LRVRSRQHKVADVVAGDAACGREEAHGFTIAAVEGEGDLDLLAVVAADLETVGAPAAVLKGGRWRI
jgi:hypothetical protein